MTPGPLSGWHVLGWFWTAILLLFWVGAGVLQLLGPPHADAPARRIVTHGDPVPMPHAIARHAVEAVAAMRPGRDLPGPTTDPDPALLERFGEDRWQLPRIATDGRASFSIYAAGFDSTSVRPRVAVIVGGIGMSEADSLAAIRTLPGGVTLAVSPTGSNLTKLLERARIAQHEYLLSVPMEPQGFPANDPDDRIALMTTLPPEKNLLRIRTLLGRAAGYIGITNLYGALHGERLSDMNIQFEPILTEAAERGLLYVDARTAQKPREGVWSRTADIAIDAEPFNAAVLDERLDRLSHIALDNGSALGIVSLPRPVTLDRLVAWTNSLASKGLALAPVSAIVWPPAHPEDAK
jgi:polysaccharide deacetylase 2 family uncharacterized protein YibQ